MRRGGGPRRSVASRVGSAYPAATASVPRPGRGVTGAVPAGGAPRGDRPARAAHPEARATPTGRPGLGRDRSGPRTMTVRSAQRHDVHRLQRIGARRGDAPARRRRQRADLPAVGPVRTTSGRNAHRSAAEPSPAAWRSRRARSASGSSSTIHRVASSRITRRSSRSARRSRTWRMELRHHATSNCPSANGNSSAVARTVANPARRRAGSRLGSTQAIARPGCRAASRVGKVAGPAPTSSARLAARRVGGPGVDQPVVEIAERRTLARRIPRRAGPLERVAKQPAIEPPRAHRRTLGRGHLDVDRPRRRLVSVEVRRPRPNNLGRPGARTPDIVPRRPRALVGRSGRSGRGRAS